MKSSSLRWAAAFTALVTIVLFPSGSLAQSAPSITQQPTNQIGIAGSNVTFSISASGAQPLHYQWYYWNIWHNYGTALNDDGRITGSHTANLNISALQASDATGCSPTECGWVYQVQVTNAFGSANSDVAALDVIFPPTIVPSSSWNITNVSGGSVFLNAVVNGSLSYYQWYFNGNPILDNPRIIGNAGLGQYISLEIRNLQTNDTGLYWIVASNIAGIATSSVATVTVLLQPPTFTQVLTDQVKKIGNNVAFSSPATGSLPITYQWFLNGVLLSDDNHVKGSTNSLLNVVNIQTNYSGNYWVVASNEAGVTTSAVARLSILPTFIQQPLNQTIPINSNVTFIAIVEGDQSLNYKWFFNGTAMTDTERIAGSANSSLSISNVQMSDAGSYTLVVTNIVGSVTSSVAALTIPAMITSQPTNQTALSGNTVMFTVTAVGTAPLKYLWYTNGTALANGGRISGATNSTLVISSVQTNDVSSYQVVVTNNYGAVTSSVATLTVNVPVQITGQPSNRAVPLNSNTSFAVIAIGDAPLNYQWYFNGTPISDDEHISGSAAPILNISNAQSSDAGNYRVVVTNLWSAKTSIVASLTIQAVSPASVLYVNANSINPQPPYLDWSTAATNIQDAVDSAINGNQILVTNGVYNSGGAVVYGQETNRVALTKAVTLLSVNGPEATMIVGGTRTRGVYVGTNAILGGFTITNGHAGTSGDLIKERCGGGIWCEASGIVTNCLIRSNSAWDTSFDGAGGGGVYGGTLYNCTIDGNLGYLGGGVRSSTLWNCTLNANKNNDSSSSFAGGGGAYLSALFNCTISSNSTSPSSYGHGAGAYQCVLSNCIVRGNIAFYSASGGGTCQGTNYSCILSNNTVAGGTGAGGGSYQSTNYYCILTGNTASSGGGSCDGRNYNCLITRNSASSYYGGGVCRGTHFNCTIVNNSATNVSGAGGGAYQSTLYNSIVYFNFATTGSNWSSSSLISCCTVPGGSVTSDPNFVNLAGGNFRLQTNSPCINAGNNFYVTNSTDLDGRPRIVGGTVDIGTYEFQGAGMGEFIGWLQQYGLPTDGSADYVDTDGDGMNNRREWKTGTNPTNAASFLKILSTSNNVSGTTVTWQSVSGVTYFLQSSTNLGGQPAFSTIQSNIVGQVGTTSYTDTTATNGGSHFYRVGVQ